MSCFLEQVLPWLGAIDESTKQEGAIEAMACIRHTKLLLECICACVILIGIFCMILKYYRSYLQTKLFALYVRWKQRVVVAFPNKII